MVSFKDESVPFAEYWSNLKLVNSYQEIVYSTGINENVITIPTEKFQEGVYYLQLTNADVVIARRMLISR